MRNRTKFTLTTLALLVLAFAGENKDAMPVALKSRLLVKAPAIPMGVSSVTSTTWNTGDVFVAVSGGCYKVYDNTGVFKEQICDGLGGLGITTGCAFNPALTKLYTTNWLNAKVVVYDNTNPHAILNTIDAGVNSSGGLSESVVFASDGSFYVGHALGNGDIQKYNATDIYVTSYDVATESAGSDWIDLSSDQATMFYTSEGVNVKRFNVSTNTQLADFGNTGGQSFALRLLPPGDGTGGLLVANTTSIKRLNGSGNVVQIYDATGENFWFALNLDPNGTSFWSADNVTSNFYKFNIATGAIEVGPINTGTGSSTVFGLCVKGEITGGVPRNCPLTQGYWKNHPSAWPVTSLTLGCQTYTQAEMLAILNTPIGSGKNADASLILADQLIAAKLSIANGSDPAPISATIADANALLCTFSGKLPYKVKPSSTSGQLMTSDASMLDQYNNALLTPNCTP